MSLLPCKSTSNVANCAAVAIDDVDGDVSANIEVLEVTCAATSTCLRCPITMASLGTCEPGNYVSR